MVGCGTTSRPTEANVSASQRIVAPLDRLGLDDTFEVRVYGEPEMSGEYRVGADGTFDFPLAGRVLADGKTVAEVQGELVHKLKGAFFRNPQITIMYKERSARKISVLGQVQKPGPIPYFPNMTIVDAVASAGGFTAIAAKNSVTLRRETLGKVELKSYPVADISEGRSTNVPLLPGDVVVVDERLF